MKSLDKRKRIVIKTLAIVLCVAGSYAPCASPAESGIDPWKSMQFLIGTWDARTEGGSAAAAGAGTYTFQPELRNHVLVRHSSSEKCKGPADYDCKHADLLFVYQEAPDQSFKAIYFDNDGHVIHCDVSVPTPTTVIMFSEPSRPGPQFRIAYELKGATMYGKFQMCSPGQTEFHSYLEWSGPKK
jgi:hypothetical protein